MAPPLSRVVLDSVISRNSPIRHRRLPGRNGFTLAEVIITFAVLGVVCAFLVVALSPMERSAVNARNDDNLQNAVALYNQAVALGGGGANGPTEALSLLAQGLTVHRNGETISFT